MVTRRVAEYVASLDYRNIPRATVETTKRLLLDGIGCLIAGTRGGPGRIAARATARLLGGAGHSTIFINGTRASARDAAFVNGITLYSVGVNDIHKPSGSHPGGCVIPATLATGEWLKSSGRELIAAMIAGYDVMGKLGRAMIPSHRERGFHPTGTFGAFGATAAAGRLLRLNEAQMASALGIAGSQASGLKAFQTDGSLTMIFHAGRAAQNGVEASLLAQEGFSGPHTVIEDEQGFASATADHFNLDAITSSLGKVFEVDATSFRPYYGCTLTICASGATAAIMKSDATRRAEDVAAVTVRCLPIVVKEVGNEDPRTLLAARLSLQFNVALVVTRGDVVVGDITENELWDPRIRRLLPLIRFETDDGMPRYGSVVTIRFKDGSEEQARILSPKGDPQNAMTWDDTVNKFIRLIEPLADAGRAGKVIQAARKLEETDGAELISAIDGILRSRVPAH